MNAAPLRVLTAAWPSPTEPRRARFLEDLHRALEGPFRTEVVTPRVHESDPLEELRTGLSIARFPYPSGGASVRVHGISPLAAVAYLGALHTTARERWGAEDGARRGLVLAHWLVPAGPIALGVARRLGRPLVLYAHGSDLNRFGRGALGRAALRHVIPRAARILVASEALGDRVRELVPDPPPISVVPLGVHAAFEPAPDPPPPPPPLRVLFVGDPLPSKGAPLVARAVVRAREEGLPVEIDWIGKAAPASEHPGREVGTLRGDLTPREVARTMARSHLLLLPSEHEGTPLVLQEAFTMRLPWAATPVGGIPALSEGRVGGCWLPEPSDGESIVEALVAIFRERLAEGAAGSRRRWLEMSENEVASLAVASRAEKVRAQLEEVLRWAS